MVCWGLEVIDHVFSLSVKCADSERTQQARLNRVHVLRRVFDQTIPAHVGNAPPLGNCAEVVAMVVARPWSGIVHASAVHGSLGVCIFSPAGH
jgi:hypothetical protein